ncbi:xanthine dehydrogenase family protein molybdopterin-binding subunit [Pseudooceanicola marinus]|uniref:xanthine dehydrogenase family protein molybdopterin-binding subunit n=1 Tax=Pseudooceanicola marinus TaxID=396013 RepID=UPI001CD7B761|nr:molybdopterin cofactor-binding domain-containing protein [Pseudooceanicola marinus]MCA1337560.1 molybdopterin-dependent oxidoreductase [Pseudooceanicola marinus]
MSKATRLTRRAVIVGSLAVTGGLAVGIYALNRDWPNPLEEDLPEGAVTFNPWILISEAGITLMAPHTDLGQGIRHLQAALIAEELDVDLDQPEVTVEPGPAAPAYANRALAAEGLPFMSQDQGTVATIARAASARLMGALGLQGTGGSSSTPDSYVKLREAGAMAREMLKAAAAYRENLAMTDLRTERGTVILPDGRALPYAELAEAAARELPPREIALRAPSQWRLLGRPMQRLDILAKSTGTLDYGIDLTREGMVHATVKLNPRPGGDVLSHDDSAALAVPGVSRVLPVSNGLAVVADSTWTAFKGAEALVCDWGPAPFLPEQADHWAALATALEGPPEKVWRDTGAQPDRPGMPPRDYRAPYLAHAPLEPLSALIHVTEARCDIWVSSQFPGLAEQKVAAITGVPREAVHLHNQYSGGSFGHRLEFENIIRAAEIGTAMRGTPVKLTYTREEDMAHDFPRQIAMARASGQVADGQVQALDLAIAAPSVTASQMGRIGFASAGADSQTVAGAWSMPYALPALRVAGHAVADLAPVSSWRSVGASTAGFFAESALDELIHEAGADPLAERLRLCDYAPARACLEAVGEMSDWGSPLPEGTGRGVAMVLSFGTPVAEVVEVHQTDAGLRIAKVWVAADVGRVLDPVNFENLVQGGVIWGLGHAVNCEVTYADGIAEPTNYYAHAGLRMPQAPEIFVRGLETGAEVRGIGEPPVPPAAPALANAIFAATGQRLREMPFANFIDFA